MNAYNEPEDGQVAEHQGDDYANVDTDINEMYALISPVYGKSQASELYGVSFIGPHKETTSRLSAALSVADMDQ
ncbi:hypothetical protein N0V87_008918 [Didymella glomerata]|uniref:Uncharacterized protein n=1 Tax=Didymella glomerata TaxID=749621 RepID=A0A9W8WSP5_9PLEO|nr:hypothetical protein N0V87_008918 [Didymella glomerata]